MSDVFRAVYHDGAFIPKEPCDVPEDSEVLLMLQGPASVPPEVTDLEQRANLMRSLVERMRATPLPVDAPRLSREALHERR
ncbi:MAG: antitoxin family protein [Acidobacteriota bacterium]